MGKLLAIAFSDLHYHDWNKFNEGFRRTGISLEILERLMGLSKTLGVPLLFTGDFFHKQSGISNELFSHFSYRLPKLKNLSTVVGISGNHDQSQVNNLNHQSPSLYSSLCKLYPSTFTCIDFRVLNLLHENSHIRVAGIPYITYNKDFSVIKDNLLKEVKKFGKNLPKILLIHSNLHGSKETDGRLMSAPDEIPENMDEFFQEFDWVLCGHIHRPQRIGKKIIQIGSPNQQKVSDAIGKFGYWEIYDNKAKFIELSDLPKFRFYKKGEEPSNETDYWIAEEDIEEVEEQSSEEQFSVLEDRGTLARKYCKAKGIKSKKKINLLTDLLND